MARTIRLAMVQMRDSGTPRGCLDAAAEWTLQAADRGAQIVCLQELLAGAYPCQSEDHRMFELAQSIPGPATDRFAKLAADREIVIVLPLFERRAPGLYHNSAAIIDADGSLAGVYRKMHIPDDPLYYEKFYFTPGDAESGFRPVKTRFATLGVAICWDQWFPEAARLLAIAGAEILLYPTAIGWIDEEKADYGESQRRAWRTVMRAHAICNGVFLGAANRTGVEGRVEFWGSSFIDSPYGDTLAEAGTESDGIVTADCRLDDLDVARTHWPFLRDRRVDAYGGLNQRWIDAPNPEESEVRGGD